MILRYRGQGQGRFRKADVQLTRQLLSLIRHADAARDSYSRGVNEERTRIARDLHDDVSARLLTSLHRENLHAVRGDVRSAMAEIRVIINGLSGDAVDLDQILADLRHETAERLATAGLALHWPIGLGASQTTVLDYRIYKVLISSVRETVTNTLKHASATRVDVAVHVDLTHLLVVISDDGVGAPAAPPRSGRGLINLRTRLEQIDGELEFEHTIAGARTQLRMPMHGARVSSRS